MRRLGAWVVALIGAFFALAGMLDVAVGPELWMTEAGPDAVEPASRWWGLV